MQRSRMRTHLVARVERLERFLIQSREAQVSDLDLTGSRDEDVGRLEITMDDPVVVKVRYAVK